ncbi:Glucose/ribitol dehydrogenase [Cynara cardunculus var. scolymus]|uniref:Glucose/ribitol dehydrogenase n=1 Tax=Cynara cardunculus var. scolymus TaxID=59895 RepID=A0A103XRV9_CYNCS|nr:Glucose/ribitol dehydrogenase [Cynara cardunculus var. scolymus]
MYEALFNNKFTDALVFYFSVLLLLLFSPFLFTWELITTLRSCFQKTENVAGKVVLITGASSGIGELMAYEYAKRGACLAIIAIKEANSRLEEVAERARELGSPDVLFLFADVSKVDECRMFVDDTVKHFGRRIGPLYAIDIDVTKFRPVMDINFWGSVYPTQFAIPHLQKTKGKIIVNASSAGLLNLPKGGFYNASKAALISFYDSLRFEVSPTITITILTLGFIQTDFITAKYSTNGDMGTLYPSMGAKPCAKAIVDGVCKGATSIAEPRFIKALIVVKFLFPELHRIIFDVSLPSDSPTD